MERQYKQEDAQPLNECVSTIESINFEQLYNRILENSINGLIIWDHQYRIIDVNPAVELLLETSKEKLVGQLLYEPFYRQESQVQQIKQHIQNTFENGRYTSVVIFVSKLGRKQHFEYHSQHSADDQFNITVVKDITEMVEMQEQLRKSDTLSVIGELAAGIAHEIRNPMTALKGFIQLLEGSIRREHSMYYEVITTELQRIDTIINEFLLLAKPQASKFQLKDVKQIMRETIDLLNAQAVLHNIQFITEYGEQLPLIYCESNQLKKVFINLIKNAIEGMPAGGKITVIINQQVEGNGQIHIAIQDEGMGIPKEQLKRLGEPFYTTKERGTGLGLMVSYKIIEEHKGSIWAESDEGQGTIFHIILPIDFKQENL
ncbi:ATP-binding protein [Neobacillus dielmonensis]|uniref:ATP-binding protein n=1 Tax=Neobacillus dielmonensis TaxID=1347369 RepID=UPI0005AA12A3|nr:ATP-binding protein [Neobacillus dielmonensis]